MASLLTALMLAILHNSGLHRGNRAMKSPGFE
jgi:hypothetical protein